MKMLEKTGEDKRGFTRRAFFSLDMVYRYRLIIDFRGSVHPHTAITWWIE